MINTQSEPREKMTTKIPFQKPLENVLEVLVGTASKTPQERLEALRPIGYLNDRCEQVITNAYERIENEAKAKDWNGEWNTPPRELEIHDLRNRLAFLSKLKVFKEYDFIEKYQEIGDTTPEKMLVKDGWPSATIEDFEEDDYKHPIAEFTERSRPYQKWSGRRTFTPDDHIELAKIYKIKLEEFKDRIVGDRKIRDLSSSMLEIIGPEAYENAVRILDEEYDRLEKEY